MSYVRMTVSLFVTPVNVTIAVTISAVCPFHY